MTFADFCNGSEKWVCEYLCNNGAFTSPFQVFVSHLERSDTSYKAIVSVLKNNTGIPYRYFAVAHMVYGDKTTIYEVTELATFEGGFK